MAPKSQPTLDQTTKKGQVALEPPAVSSSFDINNPPAKQDSPSMLQWIAKKSIIEASKLEPFDFELDDMNKLFSANYKSSTGYDCKNSS